MGLLGQAVLAIWNDVAPDRDAEFDDWHIREHIPERVGIPGFLRGRRYTAVVGTPRYFTLYETERLATLASPAYVERLNHPTPWTRRSLPLFRNTKRTACGVSASTGVGIGGALATLELGPATARDEELRAWLTGTALPTVRERPGVVGVHLCEADADVTTVETEEKKLRDQPDALARWVLLVEGLDASLAERAYRDTMGAEALESHGVAGPSSLAVYALVYALTR